MDSQQFTSPRAGRVTKAMEGYYAFSPNPLPPDLPPNWALSAALSAADRKISQLEGAASKLPNPHLLIIPFTRKEAVLSSKIEGTMASLSDLMSFEALGLFPDDAPEKKDDIREVSNYVKALEYGLKRMNELPLSLRLIREMHGELMRGVRGEEMSPGNFRKRQNWLGPSHNTRIEDATFVPPGLTAMTEALADLERYFHAEATLPPLVKVAVVHYQFEAIHPFLDGNGRIGRLLITLMLIAERLLSQPLLYLSAYFDRNRDEYYQRLLRVSQHGEWEEWITFFLTGIAVQAEDALRRADQLQDLQREYKQRLMGKRTAAQLLALVEKLFGQPLITAKWITTRFGVTPKTAQDYLEKLKTAGILEEVTGKRRYRVYAAPEILRIVDA